MMRVLGVWVAAGMYGAATCMLCACSPHVSDARSRLRSVDPGALRATSGNLERRSARRFAIRAPSVRAEFGHSPRNAAELAFVYLGPTRHTAPLRSGELRRQIGLKLRARDSCNVLYVMWRIAPAPGLLVTAKHNPGQHSHAECLDRGYVTLEPDRPQRPLPELRPGERHTLFASVEAGRLNVEVDGTSCWSGPLPATMHGIDGPVGLRSDNGAFEAEFRAAE